MVITFSELRKATLSIVTYARDRMRRGIVALCEAAAFYRTKNRTLWDAMTDMYKKYGYYKDSVESITMKGIEGLGEIQQIMTNLRGNPPSEIGKYTVTAIRDYKKDTVRDLKSGKESRTGLPESNVLYYELTDGAWVCVRPSGTEPKVKFYLGVREGSMEEADEQARELGQALLSRVKAND